MTGYSTTVGLLYLLLGLAIMPLLGRLFAWAEQDDTPDVDDELVLLLAAWDADTELSALLDPQVDDEFGEEWLVMPVSDEHLLDLADVVGVRR